MGFFSRGILLASAITMLGSTSAAQVLSPAPGTFLLSRPDLPDPNFNNTVVLLVEYAPDEGAFGIIVNRPTSVPISRVFPQAGTAGKAAQLFFGGPVSGDVLLALFASERDLEGAARVFDDVFLSGDRELMVGSIGAGGDFRVYAGYSGWAPGQLDAEMTRGDWIVLPAEREVVFSEVPGEEWQRLYDRANRQFIERGGARPAAAVPAGWVGILANRVGRR
jgi:putative transcriptional regulator